MGEAGPSAATGPPLALAGLRIDYGAKRAVDALSLTVNPGEIYGLLGSNGAGKSSTIRAVVGLIAPTAGRIQVFGLDPTTDGLAVKRLIGYVPESPLLFDALTPREFLEYVASIRELPTAVASDRARRYVQAFQVEAEFDRPLGSLSNGTRQKILLIAAFLHEPPLLVLDEPLNNLDPRAVRIMKELLRRYVGQQRRGVLFSTHTMEVAEQLCDRVGILDRGMLKGEGSLAALRLGGDRRDATLESIFLRLTAEEEGVRAAVQSLGGGSG